MSLIVCNLTGTDVVISAANAKRAITVPAKVGALTYGPPVDVTSELNGLTGGQYAALEVQRLGGGSPPLFYYWANGVPLYAATGLTVAANLGNTVAVQNTTTTVSALVQARKVEFPSTTKAPDLISVVDAVLPSNVALTLALQPDVARKLQVRIVTGSTAGTLTLVGVDQNGNAATQAIDISTSGGTRTVVTDKAYATLTSATVSGGSGFAGTVGIGLGAALGVPTNKSPAATAFAVYKAQVSGLNEAVGTVDATAMTIAPTTPADAAHSFAFWYNFTVTPTSPTHNHTLA
jgi:hypothetical protein